MADATKGPNDYLLEGDWNVVCSMCGRKRKASMMQKNWQGMWRCPEHNEPRHPQEYVRAVPDIQTPPWTQPAADVFAAVCFPLDMCGIADFAVADCAICDYVSPSINPDDIPLVAKVYLTSGSSWPIPSNWSNTENYIEVIGGGGGGSKISFGGGGGGGGAYSKVEAVTLSGVMNYAVGNGGGTGNLGDDTWFGGTVGSPVVMAKGGSGGSFAGGAGGAAASGVGDVKYSGGHGGATEGSGNSGGGGGAGGPSGDGADGGIGQGSDVGGGGGGANNGTAGTNGNSGGAGGVIGGGHGGVGTTNAIAGTGDACFNTTYGAGGGGGGGGNTSFHTDGGTGGTYGGGGGGSGASSASSGVGVGGQGLIVITYVIYPSVSS